MTFHLTSLHASGRAQRVAPYSLFLTAAHPDASTGIWFTKGACLPGGTVLVKNGARSATSHAYLCRAMRLGCASQINRRLPCLGTLLLLLGRACLLRGVVLVSDGEEQGQVRHVPSIRAQGHEAGVQLGVQGGQVVHVARPAQQLLEEEACQGQLQQDALQWQCILEISRPSVLWDREQRERACARQLPCNGSASSGCQDHQCSGTESRERGTAGAQQVSAPQLQAWSTM